MYGFSIYLRQSTRHGSADALSRRPCKDCKKCERAKEKECMAEPGDPQCSIVKTRKKAELPGPKGGWLKGLTSFELREAQLADASIRPVIQWKEATEGRPEWPSVASESPTVKS